MQQMSLSCPHCATVVAASYEVVGIEQIDGEWVARIEVTMPLHDGEHVTTAVH